MCRSIYELWGQGNNLRDLKQRVLQYPEEKMVKKLIKIIIKRNILHIQVMRKCYKFKANKFIFFPAFKFLQFSTYSTCIPCVYGG